MMPREIDLVELNGWEDGFYAKPRRVPVFGAQAYVRGYWAGCQSRGNEDRVFNALCQEWAIEDAATGGEP